MNGVTVTNFQSAFTSADSSDSHVANPVSMLLAVVLLVAGMASSYFTKSPVPGVIAVLLASYLLMAFQMANAWERVVVLRFGHFRSVVGPGLFWIIPFVDRLAAWVDTRIQTSSFTAEVTLTKDTVPVNVDAVLFWVGNYRPVG